jgi:hypothetical protein
MNESRHSGEWPKPTFSEWGPGEFEKQAEAYRQEKSNSNNLKTTWDGRELVGLSIAIALVCVFIAGTVGLALRSPIDKVSNILSAGVDTQTCHWLGGAWSWLQRWWCKSAMRRLLVLEGIAIAVAVMLSARRGVFEDFAQSHQLAYMLIVVTLPAGWVLRKPISRWLEEATR